MYLKFVLCSLLIDLATHFINEPSGYVCVSKTFFGQYECLQLITLYNSLVSCLGAVRFEVGPYLESFLAGC
jgi:hypothetical protein